MSARNQHIGNLMEARDHAVKARRGRRRRDYQNSGGSPKRGADAPRRARLRLAPAREGERAETKPTHHVVAIRCWRQRPHRSSPPHRPRRRAATAAVATIRTAGGGPKRCADAPRRAQLRLARALKVQRAETKPKVLHMSLLPDTIERAQIPFVGGFGRLLPRLCSRRGAFAAGPNRDVDHTLDRRAAILYSLPESLPKFLAGEFCARR
jgi:hypothetical protein